MFAALSVTTAATAPYLAISSASLITFANADAIYIPVCRSSPVRMEHQNIGRINGEVIMKLTMLSLFGSDQPSVTTVTYV